MSSKRARPKTKSRGPSRPVQARYTSRYAPQRRRPDTFVIGLVGVSTVLVVLIVLWITTANRGSNTVASPGGLTNGTTAAVVPTPVNGAIPTPNGPQWTATAIAFATETAPLARISPAELKSLLAANNVKLVDVRTAAQYATQHIKGATNVPQNDTFSKIKEFPKEGNLVVYCQ